MNTFSYCLIHKYFLLKFDVQHKSHTAYKTHFSEYCKYGTYVKIGDIQLIDTISVHNFPFTPDGILHCTPHCMEKKTQISVITLRHAHYTPLYTLYYPRLLLLYKEPTCYWARIRKHQCPTIQFFVCKDREQQHAAIRKLVCNNNKGIELIGPFTIDRQ